MDKRPLYALALAGLFLIAAGDDDDEDELEDKPEPEPEPDTGSAALPHLAVGAPDDPEVASLLVELDAFLTDEGVGAYTSARELTRMPSAPGEPSAIPPHVYWPNIVPTLKLWQQKVREPLGVAMQLRAYRPAEYNAAVGGAANSGHLYFRALDVALVALDDDVAVEAAKRGAAIYKQDSGAGVGVYGYPRPTHLHLDTGHGHRHWAQTKKWW